MKKTVLRTAFGQAETGAIFAFTQIFVEIGRKGSIAMIDITALGEILIDLTQTGVDNGIPSFAANPGGAPANLAVAASRLGAKTAFIGKVGRDSFGAQLKRTLADNGVDVSGLWTDEAERTTLAVVSVDGRGERSFAFYRDPSADVNLTETEALAVLQPSKVLHFGSLSLVTEPVRSATYAAVRAAKAAGACISYDPNYRASIWNDEPRAIRAMRQPLPLVDILKVSEEELPLLTGLADLEAGSRALCDLGIRLVFVTLGENGAFYRCGDRIGACPGERVRVADTNGAGDTFFGAALSQLVKFDSIDALTPADLDRITAYANRAAAITASRSGAIPAMPTATDLA